MPDSTDRLAGARSTFGVKKPVVAATTGNITLSGAQTIDGIACVADDRVLVKDQTSSPENGIYTVASGAWSRAKDFDGTTDWCKGTLVIAAAGTINAGKLFRVTSSNPVDIDTDDITFESVSFLDAHSNSSVVASATINLSAIDADAVDVTGGGATITAITLTEGYTRIVRFTGANTLTHSATLVLPGALNITTADGDFAFFRGYSSSTVRCLGYSRANGEPLHVASSSIASAATTDLGSVLSQHITITGVTPITSFGTAAATGATKFCKLSGAILLTNGANLILPSGQNIQGADGDAFIARYEGSSVWRVLNFTRALAPVINTESTSNSATSESDLLTYSLPANRLGSSVAYIRAVAYGVTSTSTAATKRMRLYFGATAVADTGALALAGGTWHLEALIARTSAAGAQSAYGRAGFSTGAAGAAGTSMAILMTTPAETLSAAVTIKVTGLATASTGQITARALLVETFPN